ncbi:MAG: hypothetical protein C4289_17010 [Chloroflexota bacterium]
MSVVLPSTAQASGVLARRTALFFFARQCAAEIQRAKRGIGVIRRAEVADDKDERAVARDGGQPPGRVRMVLRR